MGLGFIFSVGSIMGFLHVFFVPLRFSRFKLHGSSNINLSP